jgi:hypothetical protein
MSKRVFHGIKAQASGDYREETLLGRDYIVIPVVALVEGVLQGMTAEGPELALAAEFGRFVDSWNNRPITVEHPVNDDGVPVSANSPAMLKKYSVGKIFNAHISDKKLMLEAWVEVDRARVLNTNSKNILSALKKKDMIEVSTGYFSLLEESSGEYEGDEYIAIQRDIVPDHLAFLPEGTIGACSNEDGCGAPRTNAAFFHVNACDCGCGGACKDTAMPTNEMTEDDKKKMGKKKRSPDAYSLADFVAQSFPNSMFSHDAANLISQTLRKMQKYSYVIGLTKDMVVYQQYDTISGDYKTYQRTYDVTAQGKVTLGDDVQEVALVTQILKIEDNAPTINSDGATPTDNQETTMTTTPKGPEAPQDTAPNANATVEPKITVHKSKTEDGVEVETHINEKGEVVKTVVAQKAPEPPKTLSFNELLAQADPSVKESIANGVKLHEARKAGLIKGLLETNRCKFDEPALKAMSIDMLENLAVLADVPSFEGRALPNANATGDDEAVPEAPRALAFNAKGEFEDAA